VIGDAVAFLTADELADAYRARELSPVEVTEILLERIRELESLTHAYDTVTARSALQEAQTSEERFRAGRPLGPLDGVPMAVKDVIETAGVQTRGHSKAFAHHLPECDAPVVTKLRHGGAVVLGKLSLYELGGGQAQPTDEPPPAGNPWSPDRVPGGSSSGAASAVSAGLCSYALGTDTGGSIRAPAAYCGVVGLKPTFGLVSTEGCLQLAPSLDHIGPLARTCSDAAAALRLISTRRLPEPEEQLRTLTSSQPLAGLRIGAPRAFVESHPSVDEAAAELYSNSLEWFRQLGATVRDVALPAAEHEFAVYTVIVTVESYARYATILHSESRQLQPSLHNRMITGALFTPDEYALARRGRAMVVEEMRAMMTSTDLLCLPTAPHIAPTWEEERTTPDWKRPSFRRLFNLSGQPALSVPAGLSREGLPIGMQLVGRWFEDLTVLAVGGVF
jgi:aspartyl-tRNA(Asn)/glutamyl-tRNA(Gln) amidotransferase subunit A